MASEGYRFGDFVLEPANRRLSRDGATLDVSSRYLDALLLLVREDGRLVTKDRFLDEVWRGVPVTDEALTQCIRTLRRVLGDDAVRPRFIETAPKHGYRFIAAVERTGDEAVLRPSIPQVPPVAPAGRWSRVVPLALAGMAGGGGAGALGGLIYGLIGAAQPGVGAASALAVLIALTLIVGLMGGLAVGLGIAASEARTGRLGPEVILGAGLGGMLVGGVSRLLGLDAFNLLFGEAPKAITGAGEGLLLGAAVGLGAWLATRFEGFRRGLAVAGLCGAAAGALIPLLGGRLMAGSLQSLAASFPQSRLDMAGLGAVFGEDGLGLFSQIITGAGEGLLFTLGVVAAMAVVRRR